ncbi:MarR family winged helix-turn-helix transcriptional regulator [Xylophilus sp. ASV27]|uniref:MarR family winged helix-turn-helix transcriptional regulator n=1 Tax=Xylophilus sp. ASV27 TaxID=2795129 RepID=UPI0018ECC7AA|nr:MarR family winged helix-turn-helix transcriptional regulator [Xylophilus sp. ASV27]
MKTASPADKPRGCTNLKLRQLTRRVTQHYDAEVGKTGLKTTQYSLLCHVLRFGPLRSVELAALMQMTASTLSRNLQVLVAEGLLVLEAGPDARSRLVCITEAGRARQREAQRHWKAAQLSLNALLGEQRVAALHAVLDEALAAMAEPAGDEGAADGD